MVRKSPRFRGRGAETPSDSDGDSSDPDYQAPDASVGSADSDHGEVAENNHANPMVDAILAALPAVPAPIPGVAPVAAGPAAQPAQAPPAPALPGLVTPPGPAVGGAPAPVPQVGAWAPRNDPPNPPSSGNPAHRGRPKGSSRRGGRRGHGQRERDGGRDPPPSGDADEDEQDRRKRQRTDGRRRDDSGERYVPSSDPATELCGLAPAQIGILAATRPNWLFGLLITVSRAHPSLRPQRPRSRTRDALIAISEGYQAQLAHRVDEAAPPAVAPHGAHSYSGMAHHGTPPAARVGFEDATWGAAPKGPGLGGNLVPPGPAPAFSNHVEPPTPVSTNTWKTVEQIPPYPGQGVMKATLHVHERMGPTILTDMPMGGRDLELHVRGVISVWKQESKNFSPAAHADAVNLARAVHLLILEAQSPQVALRASRVPEMLLRRLLCLLEVERLVAQNNLPRQRAWQTVDSVLEHRPEAYVSDSAMAKYVADRFNALSKFETNAAKSAPGHAASGPLDDIRDAAISLSHSAPDALLSDSPAAAAPDFVDVWSRIDMKRGAFCDIDATRIDLSPIPACPWKVWVHLLPPASRPLFLSEAGGLLGDFRHQLAKGLNHLPPPRVSALPGHYPKVVSRASAAGLIVWTSLLAETTSQRAQSDAITVTSFAVRKDEHRDRLISWPLAQNTHFAQPPDVDLPHPGVLSRLHVRDGDDKASMGFELDVANMFHQLVLPRWLSLLLPLTKVTFGDLSGISQRTIMRQLGLTRRPRQNTLFRPHLRTMPMGFAWAVHVAHEIAATLLRQSLAAAAKASNFLGRTYHLSKHGTHFPIRSGNIAVGHIIDDVIVVGFGHTKAMLLAAQSSIWSSFSRHGLLLKISKSTPLGVLQCDGLTFIGFHWNFSTGILRPKDGRVESASALQYQSDRSFAVLDAKSFQSLMGKVIWLSVSRQPLLSLFRCAVLPCALDTPSARAAAGRELRQFGRLAKLACIDTHRPLSTLVLCTDASEQGGSLVVSRASQDELEQLLVGARYNGGELLDSGDQVRNFVTQRPWRVVLSYGWAYESHINHLEAAAVLIAVRWFCTHQSNRRKVLLLSDSSVTLGTLATGRSSTPTMMRYARHVGALVLAHGIDLLTAHVPTDVNPADGASHSRYPRGHVVWSTPLLPHNPSPSSS